MLRKTKILIFLCCINSSSVFGAGFYLGAGVGPESAYFKQRAHFVEGIPPFVSANVIDKTRLSGWGLFGSIFGGYGWVQDCFYLAGELNVNANSAEFKSSNDEFIHQNFSSTKYKLNPTYGISLLPGFLYSKDTLFYGRLGYANSRFRVSTSDVSLANVNTHLNGFRFGAGINQSIGCNWAVRLEYSQVNYQSVLMHVVIDPIVKDTKITPQTAQVEFGLMYNFC